MDPIDESIEISQEKVQQQQQPIDLLENSWFFNNLFIKTKKRPPIIPRCYSDPYPSSSNFNQQDIFGGGKSMEETFSSINKLKLPVDVDVDDEKTGTTGRRLSSRKGGLQQPAGGGLMRAESAPQRVRKSSLQRCSNNNLSRTPSLPVSMSINRGDEIHDDESDFSMSRLIRQASLNQSDLLPPRSSSTKVVTQSNSTPKQRTRTKLDSESVNVNTKKSSDEGGGGVIGVRRQQQQHHHHHHHPQMNRMLGRSTSDMGFQEFQSLRDLNIEKIKGEEEPSSSSSAKEWPQQQSKSSQWIDRRSVEDDMKAQIKFWARAVASNVK